mmetsp:Transcript_18813/g.43551  ORF Transcript_18813/g.43551 Transcript_18813/m.43551 type:complete len:238 (-) Transcript_18813:1890-2603(-)
MHEQPGGGEARDPRRPERGVHGGPGGRREHRRLPPHGSPRGEGRRLRRARVGDPVGPGEPRRERVPRGDDRLRLPGGGGGPPGRGNLGAHQARRPRGRHRDADARDPGARPGPEALGDLLGPAVPAEARGHPGPAAAQARDRGTAGGIPPDRTGRAPPPRRGAKRQQEERQQRKQIQGQRATPAATASTTSRGGIETRMIESSWNRRRDASIDHRRERFVSKLLLFVPSVHPRLPFW